MTHPPAERSPTAPVRDHEVLLEVRDGAVALGGRPVLRGIDLSVHRGEVVAILGTNGSGKSTLVRTCLGLVPTTRGEVRLFGTPPSRFDAWHRVGFVPQRATAAAGVPASVQEVVASGRLSRRPFWRPAGRADRRRVAEVLETVGLADRAHDNVATLSGGQQQRVLIARALAGEPELLVLDEPTAGVDLESQQALADTLRRLLASGATVVVVAHELGPLASLVDRVVVMQDGRVSYDGPPADLPPDPQGGHHHPDVDSYARATDAVPEVSSPVDRLADRAAADRRAWRQE
ncbi:MAG: ABC transporter ATP-binding protein [Nocardioides sp.]|nr:ABC transporter ATP-binding protein [Nocardioides sp.]